MKPMRHLTAERDLETVIRFYEDTQDYWLLAEGKAPDAGKAAAFFTDGPPGCDPSEAFHLGLFLDGTLSGLAELSFGFPGPGDAYLGLMLLAPSARGARHGQLLLAEVERQARKAGSPSLYLAVLDANPRGRAFWEREGFRDTGTSRTDNSHGLNHIVRRMVKELQPSG
jgi:GNAT superfamily N-acetyltransferase